MTNLKINITGLVSVVHEVKSSEKGTSQTVEITVKRINQNNQELIENVFPVVFFGAAIEKFNVEKILGSVVDITAFLNSNLNYTNRNTNEEKKFWNLYLNAVDLKIR